MRKLLLIGLLALASNLPVIVSAQHTTIKEEIRQNIRFSASNYLAYPGPKQLWLTPAPNGKKPFYISHYGRHGSRYHNKPETYEIPYQMMASADSAGKLTPLGRDVLVRLKQIRDDAHNKWGELTPLGAKQQQQIAHRMMERFPEVFKGKTTIDARSTTVTRCILSMENFLMQLIRENPKLKIHHNATHRDMYYLNQQDKHLFSQKMDSATKVRYDAFARSHEKNDRLMRSLFNDMNYVKQHVDAGKLNYYLFKVASNIQSTDMRNKLTLYDLFTDEEVYRNWTKENAWWYIAFGGSTINGGTQPYTQRNLLRKIILDADSCIKLDKPGVQLRFGHETVVMPLTCLLDLNGYGLATDQLESLAKKQWANYKIFPMASNIQFVFYRKDPGDTDVLFKVLLNENEATLPIGSALEPYYHWKDFKEYYLKKLDAYEKE